MREEARAEAAREWQAIIYGDHPETWAALAYYRERGWPVDDNTLAARARVVDMIHGFQSGYRAALEMPRPAPPQEDRPTTRELSGTVPDIAHSRNCPCSECAPTREDRE